MKSITLCFVCLCGIVFFSCDESESLVLPDSGYIYAQVDGRATLYTDRADPVAFFANETELRITYHHPDSEFLTWSISIVGVDFQNVTYPFVIRGPWKNGMDQTAFWCNIMDSNARNFVFGPPVASTSSMSNDVELTIESFKDGIVQGTFHGEGADRDDNPIKFANGKFLARYN